MAVAHGHTQVAEGQRVKAARAQVCNQKHIARRFRHFGAVSQQMLTMHPVVHVLPAEGALALGDFVFVMGEHVVHAARVNVKPRAQIFMGHSGTFNVPAGEALTPGAVPFHIAPRLGSLPQRKVPRVALQRVGVGPYAFQQVAAEVPRQLAVFGAAVDIKVNVAAGCVGGPVVQQRPHHRQHFGDMLRRPGKYMGGQDVHSFLIPPEAVGVELRDFRDGLALGQGGQNHFVAAGFYQFLPHMPHIGNVFDVIDLVAVRRQDAPDPVRHQVGAQVSHMGIPIHRWPAGVHRNAARRNWPDFRNGLGQSVVDAQHGGHLLPGLPEGIDDVSLARRAGVCTPKARARSHFKAWRSASAAGKCGRRHEGSSSPGAERRYPIPSRHPGRRLRRSPVTARPRAVATRAQSLAAKPAGEPSSGSAGCGRGSD